jgi:glycosyltransferase involved in cell wall biosynthesis
MSHPEISVVIRTFNEEKFLPALLDALSGQAVQNFETIVVDSGSIDGTRDIAAQKADRLLRIQSHDFTFGHSLNVGIRSAKGRHIAIVSAHTLPVDDQWLAPQWFTDANSAEKPPNSVKYKTCGAPSAPIVKFCNPLYFLLIMPIQPSAKIYGNSIPSMKACRD